MAYISSKQIRVFPSVGRSNGYDIESQLTNENNLSQLVRSLCRNRKSYVLSNQLASNEPFEFVIYGFYFKILNATDTIKAIRNSLKIAGETTDEQINKIKIWAGIKLYKNAESNNESTSYQLLQLASGEAVDGDLHELDTGKPTDNPETSNFQGIIFDRESENIINILGTDGDVYVLQLLGEGTSVPVQSLLHSNTTEILDGASSNYISDEFTTKQLDVSESISDAGTLTVEDHTTLSTLTASNTQITGTLTVVGAATLSTLATESNASIGGTLNVTGETTLASVTATFVSAPTFSGSLSGNATTATNLSDERTFSFTEGDISGSATSSTGGYNIIASIVDARVTTRKIYDEAVTNAKLADEAVTTNKLANDAVTTDKIKDLNVTTSKIGNSAVTNDKIDEKAVTNAKIEDGTIKTEKLGFNLNMILDVDGKDDNHKTLTISLPTLNNKE